MKQFAIPLAMLAVFFMFLTPVRVQEITEQGVYPIMPIMYPPGSIKKNPKPKPKMKGGAKPPMRVPGPFVPKK